MDILRIINPATFESSHIRIIKPIAMERQAVFLGGAGEVFVFSPLETYAVAVGGGLDFRVLRV
jgi:hypothetical protein